jgi:hypothetical protein
MSKTIAKPAAIIATLLCVGCTSVAPHEAGERRTPSPRTVLLERRLQADIERVAGMTEEAAARELFEWETGRTPPAPRVRRPAIDPARIDPARRIRA